MPPDKKFMKAHRQASLPVVDTLVMLTTPGYAHWLEDASFTNKFVHALLAKRRPDDVLNAPFNVLMAVVDKIPSDPVGHSSQDGGLTGFSFATVNAESVLPGLFEMYPIESADTRANLTFICEPEETMSEKRIIVSLPLANTIFQNGRTSTLIASRWRKHRTGFYKQFERKDKTVQRIVWQQSVHKNTNYLRVPATPLTPIRQVFASMGNIVKKLAASPVKGEVALANTVIAGEGVQASTELEGVPASTELQGVPASTELEGVVTAYAKALEMPPAALAVWALIIPERLGTSKHSGIVSKSIQELIGLGEEEIRACWKTGTSGDHTLAIGKSLHGAILSGARMHRVGEFLRSYTRDCID